MVVPVHANLVAGGRDVGSQPWRLGDHAAEHEKRGPDTALGQYLRELRRRFRVRTIVERQRDVGGVALAREPAEGKHPQRADARHAGTGVCDRQPGRAGGPEPGSGAPGTGAPSTGAHGHGVPGRRRRPRGHTRSLRS